MLVGVTAKTVRAGIAWTLCGFVLSCLVTLTVSRIADVPFLPGYGPLFTLLLMLTAYGALAAIQASLRRRVPDFDELEAETRRTAVEENLRVRVTAAVHDTLLNDLSLVMNAPDELDSRMTDRLRQDLATLTAPSGCRSHPRSLLDEQDSIAAQPHHAARERDAVARPHGARHGQRAGHLPARRRRRAAAVDAIRVCLENVLRHSGVTVAELDLVYTTTASRSWSRDQGVGFDPETIAARSARVAHFGIDRVRDGRRHGEDLVDARRGHLDRHTLPSRRVRHRRTRSRRMADLVAASPSHPPSRSTL